MSPLVVRAVGDVGVVADVDDQEQVHRLHRALLAVPPPSAGPDGVVDLVLGARSVLVRVRPGTDLAAVARDVRHAAEQPAPGGETAEAAEAAEAAETVDVVLPVRYDGPDLDEVARLAGLTADEVVAAHTGTPWTVAFMGFAPGFAYLTGGDERLTVPRRDHPRPRVDAGAVGLAAGLSGVYPRASPGGWQLVGRTDVRLWDVSFDPPALLRPGTVVRFEAVQ